MQDEEQRGVALVLVMWVAVLLTVIAGSFIVERRTEMLVVWQLRFHGARRGIADAGVQRAVFEIYRNDNSPDALEARRHALFDGRSRTLP